MLMTCRRRRRSLALAMPEKRFVSWESQQSSTGETSPHISLEMQRAPTGTTSPSYLIYELRARLIFDFAVMSIFVNGMLEGTARKKREENI